jgi:mannose-6-phosphate isomerase-like protein (cupin superfamily)
MLIRAADRDEIDAPEDDLVMRTLLRGEDGAGLSLTEVRLSGAHRPLRSLRSPRVYYVIQGSAAFRVGAAEPVVAGPGDIVVIPRGEVYSLEGELTYLVLNAPPYADGDDVYEER